MPSRASPSLGSWLSLNITLGCLVHPQAQALATPYSIVHRIFTQNLKTSQHKTKQKTRKLRQYKKNKPPLRYCCELMLNSYGVISTVLQLLYGSYPPILLIDSSKEANNTQKTESVKNRTVCSNLYQTYTSGPPKILK